MTIELDAEQESKARKLVEAGRFHDIREVVQAGLDALDADEAWMTYVSGHVAQGVADIEAGRIVSGEQLMRTLRSARLKQA